ncbi:MAG: TetR/AcrR family transcriptional regulator [Acidothermaceae bacterium]
MVAIDPHAPARRARPLPPDERRAALIGATLALIREQGAEVSTKQIATAAAVAEGTIFRVFPDKESLIRAAIDAALDPASVVAELERIDPATPLDAKLIAVARITQAWLTSVISLMMVLRKAHDTHGAPPRGAAPSDTITPIVERLIEPDRKQLRVAPFQVAKLMRLMAFASSHPIIKDATPMTPEQIVAVLLDGVRQHHEPTSESTSETTTKDDGFRC